ncbi:hypothetical protein JCM12298_30110 [Desulfothermus naphthae]
MFTITAQSLIDVKPSIPETNFILGKYMKSLEQFDRKNNFSY